MKQIKNKYVTSTITRTLLNRKSWRMLLHPGGNRTLEPPPPPTTTDRPREGGEAAFPPSSLVFFFLCVPRISWRYTGGGEERAQVKAMKEGRSKGS